MFDTLAQGFTDLATTTGQLDISDVDTGEAVLQSLEYLPSEYGTFTYTADGSWTYVLDTNSQAVIDLTGNQTLQDTFSVTSLDGTASEDVTITIHRLTLVPTNPVAATPDPGTLEPPVVTPPVEGPPVATPPAVPPIANPNEPVAGSGAVPPVANPSEPVAGGGIPAPSPIASGPSTTLTGTPESDHFVYHLGDGPVTIVDFDPGPIGTIVDQIELAGFGVDFGTLDSDGNQLLDQMDIGINGDATSITLDLGNGDTLTVANVTTLMEDDLLFS